MSDLVERLRAVAPGMGGRDACLEAADEIERLKCAIAAMTLESLTAGERDASEIERLRAGLREIAEPRDDMCHHVEIARRLLREEK